MSAADSFEDRVIAAVVGALVDTLPYWVRGVAVRLDESASRAEVLFACAERTSDTEDGIAEFSGRLGEATSAWLRHTTEVWVGYDLRLWPGRQGRVVFAVRVAPDGRGMVPELEFQNGAVLTVVGVLAAAFGPELIGVWLASDAVARQVDVYLTFSRELSRQDRYELEEFEFALDEQGFEVRFDVHVRVGAEEDAPALSGARLRTVHRQRPSRAMVPDDFEPDAAF